MRIPVSLAIALLLTASGLARAASDAASCESPSVVNDERIQACTRAINSGHRFSKYAASVSTLSCGVDRSGLTSRWDRDDLVIRAAICVNCIEKVKGASAQVAGNLILVRLQFETQPGNIRATCDCRLGADIRLSALPKRDYKIVRIGSSPVEGSTCPPTDEERAAAAASKKVKSDWLKAKGDAISADARALENSGAVSSAVKLYRELAGAGSGPAALRLCDIYGAGKGDVRADIREASKWCWDARVLGVEVPPEILRRIQVR